MGRLFDHLTQQGSALQDPNSGQDTFVGSPQQVLSKSNTNLQSAMAPNFDDPMASAPALPRMGNASFRDAASAGAAPGGVNALSSSLSKGGKLLTLLRSGLEGGLAGRASSERAVAESGGRTSSGVGTGFEAGVQLPFLRAAMQQTVQRGGLENQALQNQVGMAPQMNLLKILQGQSEIGRNQAQASNATAEAALHTAQTGQVGEPKPGVDEQKWQAYLKAANGDAVKANQMMLADAQGAKPAPFSPAQNQSFHTILDEKLQSLKSRPCLQGMDSRLLLIGFAKIVI